MKSRLSKHLLVPWFALRSSRLLLALLVAALLFTLAHSPLLGADERWCKIRLQVPERETLHKLIRMGVDFEGSRGKLGGPMECVVSEDVLKRLQAEGVVPEILIEDLAGFYASRLTQGPVNAMGLGYGSMGGYYTFDEIRRQLDTLRLLYPHVVGFRDSIGATLQGRPIWAVRMTANPDLPSNRPQVLYFAMQHAREPIAMMTLLYTMWHLAQGYGVDPEATYLLDNRDLWFVPIVNPDGYEANRRMQPAGGGLRRKNMRDVVTDGDSRGVDLNRNWDSHWGIDDIGSNPSLYADDYRGSGPASEPETQVLGDFCLEKSFRFIMEYHAYGHMTLSPPGYVAAETADSLTFRAYLHELTRDNNHLYGTGSTLYPVNGAALDWLYENPSPLGKTIPFLVEVGNDLDGFWPATARILPIVSENLGANLFAAWGGGAFLKFQHCMLIDSSADGDFEPGEAFTVGVQLNNFGLEPTSNTVVSVRSGSPWVEVAPYAFTVTGVQPNADTVLTVSGRVSGGAPGGVTAKIIVSVSPVAQIEFQDTVSLVLGKSAIIFGDDAEQGMAKWSTNLAWGTSTVAHSGEWSFTDSPAGTYPATLTGFLTLRTPFAIPLTAVATRLQFWTRWHTEASFDYGQVQYSSDGGGTWTPLRGQWTSFSRGEGYSGWEPTWVQEDIDLSFLAGKEIRLRLALYSDASTVQDGWYVDDIAVRSYEATAGRLAELKSLEFPSVAVAESDTLKFSLRNVGVAPVDVSSLTTSQPEFSILTAGPLPITMLGTLDSSVVRVVFRPDRHGLVADTLVILSNDPINPVFNVPISGFGVLVGEAVVGTLYAASIAPTNSLFTLDMVTAETTSIGPLGITNIVALGVHPKTGQLYGMAQASGFVSLHRLSSLYGQTVPTATVPLPASRAMAFSPRGDLLIGTIAGSLYRVDTSSGDTTLVGRSPYSKYTAFAFHPTTGELWAGDIGGTKDSILKVDPATGRATAIGRTGDGQMTTSLAFDAAGNLFALNGSPMGRTRLVRIDQSSGAGTLIDTTSVEGITAIAMRSVVATGIESHPVAHIPRLFKLEQNYPNPFNPSTTIRYALPERSYVRLIVFNTLGQRIATLVEGEMEVGYHEVKFDASRLPSGVYLYRLQAGNRIEVRKAVLMK